MRPLQWTSLLDLKQKSSLIHRRVQGNTLETHTSKQSRMGDKIWHLIIKYGPGIDHFEIHFVTQ